MRVLLGFHYRDDGSRRREQIFGRVRPIVESLYSWDKVVVCDSGHTPYNRAASRNEVVKIAEQENFDVAVICDADSIPHKDSLAQAIDYALRYERLTIPFDRVKVLPAVRFNARPDRYAKLKPLYEYGESCGGIYVCTPSLWRRLGGMEERVVGWGFEDQIILSASITFASGPVFIPGVLYTINHPRDASSLRIESNDQLIRRYHAAEGKPALFREIQRENATYFTRFDDHLPV